MWTLLAVLAVTLLLPILLFFAIALPPIALAPAIVFAIAYWRARPRAPWLLLCATIVWMLYTIYEVYIFRWSQTVTAPIRVDLMLVAPILYAVTVAGLIAWRRRSRPPRGSSPR